MIKYFIGVLALLALGLDGWIYRHLKNRFRNIPWIHKLYLGQAIALDVVIVLALIFYRQAINTPDSPYGLLILWVICLFFLSILPKLIYMLCASVGYLVDRLRGRKSHGLSIVGVIAAGCVLGCMLWGATEGRSRIRVTEIEIPSDKLPVAFDGYRIAQISDIHLGNYSRHNTLIERVVRKINALHPDLIVSSGDLVNLSARELTPHYQEILAGLEAPDGVVSVLGNHDLGFYMREDTTFTPQESVRLLIEKQQAMGWRLLQNETIYIHQGTDSVSVSGIKYPRDGHHNGRDSGLGGCDLTATYRNVPDSLFNLMVSHTPQNWDDIRVQTPADLTLAGHVHAMQLKWPYGPRGWSPARWMYDRWSGLYEEKGKYLYVNDGIGYVMYPMRIGTRPEITLITLRSTQKR